MTRAAIHGSALLFMSVLLGCSMEESGATPGSGSDDGSGSSADPGEIAGDIRESGMLSGTIRVTRNATILPGVELRVAPGSEIIASQGVALAVRGTLLIDGTAEQPVSILPEEGAPGWIGIAVESGGAATIRHATGTKVATLLNCRAGAATCALEEIDFEGVGQIVSTAAAATLTRSRVTDMANAAVFVKDGGDLTVSDSELMTSAGDIVVTAGGRLLVEYSSIGGTVDTYEHCNVHVGGADEVTIRYSNIVTGTYGMMIGGIDGAVITNNNFEGNGAGRDVDPIGTVTSADFTNNYWDQGPPVGLGGEYQFSPSSPARIAQAGPRP